MFSSVLPGERRKRKSRRDSANRREGGWGVTISIREGDFTMENREGTEDGKGRKGSELSRAPTIDDSLPLRGVEQDVRRVAIGVAQYREARHSLNMLRLEQHYDSCESPRAPSRYDNLDKNVWREPRHYLNDSVAVLP